MKAALLLVYVCCPAYAHTGEPLQSHDLWGAWDIEPGIVLPLLLSAFLYARGARAASSPKQWNRFYFWSGWGTLVVALVSPLHPLGEALFSAHMVQHELLMLIAAPLLILSRPLADFLWAMPFEWRRSVGRWSKVPIVQSTWRGVTLPAAAWSIHAAAIWLWHDPRLFQATLSSNWVHSAQHISFLGSALLFWWSLIHAHSVRSYGAGVLYLFTTAVHTSVLGALLTFSRSIWYPAYQATAPLWGVSALEDQQVGGLIMWVPGGLVYLAAGLILFARWLRESNMHSIPGNRYAN